jgi:hypothetical protein
LNTKYCSLETFGTTLCYNQSVKQTFNGFDKPNTARGYNYRSPQVETLLLATSLKHPSRIAHIEYCSLPHLLDMASKPTRLHRHQFTKTELTLLDFWRVACSTNDPWPAPRTKEIQECFEASLDTEEREEWKSLKKREYPGEDDSGKLRQYSGAGKRALCRFFTRLAFAHFEMSKDDIESWVWDGETTYFTNAWHQVGHALKEAYDEHYAQVRLARAKTERHQKTEDDQTRKEDNDREEEMDSTQIDAAIAHLLRVHPDQRFKKKKPDSEELDLTYGTDTEGPTDGDKADSENEGGFF